MTQPSLPPVISQAAHGASRQAGSAPDLNAAGSVALCLTVATFVLMAAIAGHVWA